MQDENTTGKDANAIVEAKLEYIADVNVSALDEMKDDSWANDWPHNSKSHKKGEVVSVLVGQKYVKTDRSWLPYKIGRDNIKIVQ